MEFVKKEYKNLLVILVVFVVTAIFFQNKTFNLYIDFGREAFFPKSVLDGEVLYKDIFNIFGPFSYLFNAFMYKIFGVKLSTLYLVGSLNALSIVFALYYIARNFFARKLSLILSLFVIEYCFFTTTLMNYITPYSYAIVYGLNFFLISICFYLAFLNGRKEKIQYLYGTFFFAGLAFANKYEFFLYFILLAFVLFKHKINLKNFILLILSALLPVCLMFLVLIKQGLRADDFINYFHFFRSYVASPSLKNFYEGSLYFSPSLTLNAMMTLCAEVIVVGVIFFSIKFLQGKEKKLKNSILGLLGIAIAFALIKYWIFFDYYFFSYLTLLVFVLYMIKVNLIYKDSKRFFVLTAVVITSFKVFWFLYTTNGYGQYFLPMLIIASLVLLQDFYVSHDFDKYLFKKTFSYLFFVMLLVASFSNLSALSFNTPVYTPKGTISMQESDAKIWKPLLEWLEQNTKKEDKIVVLPETTLINFLLDRKSDNNFNVMKPEGIDTYGEPYIIEHFAKNPPDYFVIMGLKTDENLFSVKYAKELARWISQNYQGVFKLDSTYVVRVYKKK